MGYVDWLSDLHVPHLLVRKKSKVRSVLRRTNCIGNVDSSSPWTVKFFVGVSRLVDRYASSPKNLLRSSSHDLPASQIRRA